MAAALRSPLAYWFAMLRSVNSVPGGGAKIVPSEARESLYGWLGEISENRHPLRDGVLPASEENKLGVLATDSQVPEEIRVIRLRDVLTEFGISVPEGEQVGVLVSRVGQAASAITVIFDPNRKGRGCKNRRVERRKDSVE